MNRSALLVVLAAVSATAPAHAQLGTPVLLSKDQSGNYLESGEPNITVSPVHGRMLVGWNWFGHGPMLYAVSIDDASTFTSARTLDLPQCVIDHGGTNFGDPIVASSLASPGDMFVGGFCSIPGVGQPVWIDKVPAGSMDAAGLGTGPQCPGPADMGSDKPWLIVGLCPPQGAPNCPGETMYALTARTSAFPFHGTAIRALDQQPLGQNWPGSEGYHVATPHTWGLVGTVLRHAVAGDGGPGRLVVASSGQYLNHAWVSYSIDGGQSWTASNTVSPTLGLLDRDSHGDGITPVRGGRGPAPQLEPELPSDDFGAYGITSIATDPGDTRHVVIAFTGHDGNGPDPNNIDVYVAMSTDGATSFTDPQNPTSATVYHINDAMWGLPGDAYPSQELMPAVWIDANGRVWLMVVRASGSVSDDIPRAHASVRLAIWSSITAISAGASPIYKADVAPLFDVPSGFYIGVAGGGNDFQSLAGEDCTGFPAYIAPQPNGTRGAYVRPVRFPCFMAADFNGDGVVDAADAVAFAAAYLTASPTADFNRDLALNTNDVAAYADAFNAAMGH